jgi:polysaccharide export outer membrane protein
MLQRTAGRRARGKALIGLLAALLCVACVGTPAERAGGPPKLDSSSYRLGVGDRVRIDVFGEPDLTTEVLLVAPGTINYPLLGRVQATGLTPRDLEQAITHGLQGGYLVNPVVRVGVVQYRAIYLLGQVKTPGSYPYIEGLTVERALALAGGMTALASTRKIYLMREGVTTGQRERVQLETPIYPGDTIFVEESLF